MLTCMGDIRRPSNAPELSGPAAPKSMDAPKPGRVVRSNKDPAEKKLLDAKYDVFLDQCRTQQEYRKNIDAALKGSKLEAK